ncbi:FAD-binding oxidoreductase [Altericroceibacterium spongiae]|uniref:FAD-binding oxidoreductase n=1 Tax=Altericroceibacterium spongiae TaxID=2320269 RepID=A0A420EAH1_9SPHN|nr:FAD-binding oxidoreductase [Altericroceibacterium spongiae]RKF17674.1 FAD-binding oxidoreductase [Altericroceibacterium spongiae]
MNGFSRRDMLRAGAVGSAVMASQALASPLNGTRMLPAEMDRDVFAAAIKELRSIVGNDWVFADAQSTVSYNKSFIPDPEGLYLPSGAVAPASVEEVQAILKVANKYKLPMWPVSTGKNMGYGMATPASNGQMVLDLKRMNRIIEVDPDLGTALVEPGVTYQDMHDYLEKHNLPFWLDVPTVGPIVSMLGNTLERGVGYTPYGDHFMFQCGMEVVLPDGSILKTGMGSVKNSTTWQAFKWGYGPYLDGLFTQSNFGIVTKLGMWLMPKPPVYKPFMVRHPDADDIGKITDTIRPFRMNNLIPNGVLIMGAAYQLAMFHRREEFWSEEGSIPDDVVKKAAAKNGLGMWNTYFALYGTDEIIAATEPIIRGAFEASGGEVLTEEDMGDSPWFHHHATLMRGGMSLEEIGIVRWRGNGGGMVAFAPVAPAKGEEPKAQTVLAKEIMGKYNFDYAPAYAVGGRELHHIIFLMFDKSDPEQEKRAAQCMEEMITRFGEKGWCAYRSSISTMDLVADQYGDTNRQVNARLKRTLDPNNIIAPGKQGIG